MARLAGVGLGCALSCGFSVTLAASPNSRVASTACHAPGPATAQRVRLKTLLQQLSAQHRFRVEYWALDDPEVVRVAGSDVDVMTALSNHVNMLVRYVPAGRQCPGQWRIDTVWVLPSGEAPIASAPVAQAPPAPPDTATLLYMQAHGAALPARPGASAAGR